MYHRDGIYMPTKHPGNHEIWKYQITKHNWDKKWTMLISYPISVIGNDFWILTPSDGWSCHYTVSVKILSQINKVLQIYSIKSLFAVFKVSTLLPHIYERVLVKLRFPSQGWHIFNNPLLHICGILRRPQFLVPSWLHPFYCIFDKH